MLESQQPLISVREVAKAYGANQVLAGVSFDVAAGDQVCVVGPSGCGKSTLLRCVGGLLAPGGGEVRVRSRSVTGPPEGVTFVFQDYSRSLLPWMTVRGNVLLPLRRLGLTKAERAERAEEALDAVALSDTFDKHPWQLSGGMQQRVAIARAIACRPDALLMDEPFASVDAQTRADLEDLLLSLRARLGVTVILITHDVDEAVYLADRVIVLGGAPSRVIECLAVELGAERDQVETKSLPEFVSMRAHIFELIRTARTHATPPATSR